MARVPSPQDIYELCLARVVVRLECAHVVPAGELYAVVRQPWSRTVDRNACVPCVRDELTRRRALTPAAMRVIGESER